MRGQRSNITHVTPPPPLPLGCRPPPPLRNPPPAPPPNFLKKIRQPTAVGYFDKQKRGLHIFLFFVPSVVVYVTGDVGGPTLVTTQRLTSKRLADRGWIVHPRVNRVCMFDGGVLHGVIPGRGVPPLNAAAAAVDDSSEGVFLRVCVYMYTCVCSCVSCLMCLGSCVLVCFGFWILGLCV